MKEDLDELMPPPTWAPTFEQFRETIDQDEAIVGMTRDEAQQGSEHQ